jgi:NADPH-dependent 2,4-dienoyl-CoA reductase/sulfur reductase-like enzyme
MTRALLVVGGGPAGMSAAVAAAERGVACTVVDEGFDLGGQIWRRPTRPDAAPPPAPRGEAMRRRIAELGERVDVRRGAAAWGVFDGLGVAVSQDGRTELLAPQAIVLAPGAHELVPPFPGWTLPGVMTPGAAQVLVKTMGVAPGERVVVAGTGPFLLAVACQLVDAGVRVVAVLEATPRWPWLALPLHGWRTPRVLREGAAYLARLARARVPVRYGRVVVRAEGDERVRGVVHAPVDRDWVPDRGSSEEVAADTLLVGYGFVPRVQLAQTAGCRLAFRADVGGWVPERDRDLATSVPGVFAAGDGAGVAGALVAEAEGRIAGLAAAARLGAIDAATFAAARASSDRVLRRVGPLRRALDRISALRPGLATLADDDTTVCRCEEVTWREARDAVRAGCVTWRSLKVATRIGMGPCQGCSCWPAVSRLVAAEAGCAVADVGPATARPPVRPVTLGELAAAPPGPR